MKKYTKKYLIYFGFDICDFIPCEICGAKAVDINHIIPRSRRNDLLNDVTNLMAVCRDCHIKFGDKKQYSNYLKMVHGNYTKQFAKNKP